MDVQQKCLPALCSWPSHADVYTQSDRKRILRQPSQILLRIWDHKSDS